MDRNAASDGRIMVPAQGDLREGALLLALRIAIEEVARRDQVSTPTLLLQFRCDAVAVGDEPTVRKAIHAVILQQRRASLQPEAVAAIAEIADELAWAKSEERRV